MFVSTIARNRSGMSEQKIRDTEARLYFGINAMVIGFADQVGTLSFALESLRSAVNNPGSRIVQNSGIIRSAAQAGQRKSLKEVTVPPNQAEVEETPTLEETVGVDVQRENVVEITGAIPSVEYVASVIGVSTEVVAQDLASANYAGLSTLSERDQALGYATEVMEMCALAEMPISVAASFIRTRSTIDLVRQKLQEFRALKSEKSDIQSHVLPETAAKSDSRNINESPIVRAAEKLAQKKEN
jgi:hypothetical protein